MMKKCYLISILVFLISLKAEAQEQKKTVQELLRQAEMESRGSRVRMSEKAETSLPGVNFGFQPSVRDVRAVKPPKSSTIIRHEKDSNRLEYARLLDEQIRQLFGLVEKHKSSKLRGEMWLRLAELYVEKANLIDTIQQDRYDAEVKKFEAGETRKKPVLDLREARDLNRRAIQLYEWFLRDFPDDPKRGQALFFLGYNNFELGQNKKAEEYFQQLLKEVPRSPFVPEARFALAEYYFENEKWRDAYDHYSYLIKTPQHPLHAMSLYKGAWAMYRIGEGERALKHIETLIRSGASDGSVLAGRKTVNRVKLEQEALSDLVLFYGNARGPEGAAEYFASLTRSKPEPYLEKLAYFYSERGDRDSAEIVFKNLIASAPTAPKAFEYQYQIVLNLFYAKNSNKFKQELLTWVKDYGPESAWYQANAGNSELVSRSEQLREKTLRNFVLQQHQTAQNSRVQSAQNLAKQGYEIYFSTFKNTPHLIEMRFFFAELLYDMKLFDQAAEQYRWVVENGQGNPYQSRAATNIILALEKGLPKDSELAEKASASLAPVPLDSRVERFIQSARWYLEKFPSSEKAPDVKFRLGRLYYQNNYFTEAEEIFKDIVRRHPRTKLAEYSANLLLDIYNLRKDYIGLEKTGSELLKLPSIAESQTGSEIRTVLEKASFKQAQDLEARKDYEGSARQFEAFAQQNPRSELAVTAWFNAAVNWERLNRPSEAISAHSQVVKAAGAKDQELRAKSARLLAKIHQDAGQLRLAAEHYILAAEISPKDPLSANMIYNAAVIYESLGDNTKAIQAYEKFLEKNPPKKERAEVYWALSYLQEREGRYAKSLELLKEYLNSGASEATKTQSAELKLWRDALRRKDKREADTYRGRILAKGKKGKAAAEVYLYSAREKLEELKSIRYPRDSAKLQAAIRDKDAAFARLKNEITSVIQADSPEEIVSALNLFGEAFRHMGDSFRTAPAPSELKGADLEVYRKKVEEELARPQYEKAKESFRSAIDKALEFEVYSEDYHAARKSLESLGEKRIYHGGEIPYDVRYILWMSE
ncbi:MAG: tetratricopeptide repeat protein [Bdellovibrionaceae bacterium]|nr:tetratricopeptide repeat protein [Pseudobdellovibrionaceae bacterium]